MLGIDCEMVYAKETALLNAFSFSECILSISILYTFLDFAVPCNWSR